MEEHPSLECHVCGTPRKFVGYGSKIGKDGREAKWPQYEKCPNIGNHQQILAAKRSKERMNGAVAKKNKEREKVEELCLAPTIVSLFSAIMYDKVINIHDLETVIEQFREKRGTDPLGIVMHPFDIGRIFPEDPTPACNGIAVVTCDGLPATNKSASLVINWGRIPHDD